MKGHTSRAPMHGCSPGNKGHIKGYVMLEGKKGCIGSYTVCILLLCQGLPIIVCIGVS